MRATLFQIPASHPAMAARLMLERKGIDYRRIDIVSVVSRPILRAAGFPGVTVPALILDGVHLQGSRTIARALDVLRPEPALFPQDPEQREAVDSAELWGDEVLQPVPRRLVWWGLVRDRSTIETYLEGARIGIPISVAARTAAPLARASAMLNRASDQQVAADLRRLPALADRVDELIEQGVIGADEPNAADFQIATSVRLLMTMDDVRSLFEGRPAAELARRVVPSFPGRLPRVFPPNWLPY